MSTEEFWTIIDSTKAVKQEKQVTRLTGELQKLSREGLIQFERKLIELKSAAYTWDLWLVACLFQGGVCSDDGFADFRSWLIASGRAVYEKGLHDPDSIVEKMRRAENPEFEEFDYVAGEVYEEKFGKEMPDIRLPHRKKPAGGDWLRPELRDRRTNMLNHCMIFAELTAKDYAMIERQFPRTWAYYGRSNNLKLANE